MKRHDEQRDEGNSGCVCMLFRKLRPWAMEMAVLENTRSVHTCRPAKDNMEG